MDRCNTYLESTGRSFKAQSFSRTLIELQRYLVEIGLGVAGQVGFPGEVLSQQPVGVFVGASLPGSSSGCVNLPAEAGCRQSHPYRRPRALK